MFFTLFGCSGWGGAPKGANPRFVAWPLELGLGTLNPRFVVWPLELGLGTLNPRFVAWPDGWSCGFQSLNIAKLVVEHRGIFSNVPLVPMGAYGDLWGPMGTYEGHMGTYGGPIGDYGDLLGPMGTFGDLLAPMWT